MLVYGGKDLSVHAYKIAPAIVKIKKARSGKGDITTAVENLAGEASYYAPLSRLRKVQSGVNRTKKNGLDKYPVRAGYGMVIACTFLRQTASIFDRLGGTDIMKGATWRKKY
jgi:hypothetical protein